MADPKEPEVDPLEELTRADHRWWKRYSRHGEFPWSTLTSLALHMFILLLLAVGAAPLLDYDRTPPGVDVLVVGDEPDAAPDEGDGLPTEGGLESGAAEEAVEQMPEDMPDTKLDTVAEPEPFKPDIQRPDGAKQLQKQQKQIDDARSKLNAAREKLNEGLRNADGTGGGGGSGAAGKAARAARWILTIKFRSGQDYLTQLDGLGAHIAFPLDGDNYRFFYNASSPNRRSETRTLNENQMVFWMDDTPNPQVTSLLGMNGAPFQLIFLPRELEDRMASLERAYNNLEEDEIASTVFEVVHRGGKYDVIVASQTPK